MGNLYDDICDFEENSERDNEDEEYNEDEEDFDTEELDLDDEDLDLDDDELIKALDGDIGAKLGTGLRRGSAEEISNDGYFDGETDEGTNGETDVGSDRETDEGTNGKTDVGSDRETDGETAGETNEESADSEIVKEEAPESADVENEQTKERKKRKIKLNFPKNGIVSGHKIPAEPCWHVKRNKTGFTLPKTIREQIADNQNFALVVDDKNNKLIFYLINEEDLPKLNLAEKPEEPKKRKRTGKKASRKKRTLIKKKAGPEPEWGKYFLYEFENNDKLQEVLGTAFEKYAQKEPNPEEALEIIKYALINFVTNSRMHDSRVRQTIAFFLLDVAIKFNQKELVDFIEEKILPEIKSKYLYESTLTELIAKCFAMELLDKSDGFIQQFIEHIDKYSENDMYAIMNTLKLVVNKLIAENVVQKYQQNLIPLKEKMLKLAPIIEDNDYKLQIVDFLDKIGFTTEAFNLLDDFIKNLPEESPVRDEFKSFKRDLSNKPI